MLEILYNIKQGIEWEGTFLKGSQFNVIPERMRSEMFGYVTQFPDSFILVCKNHIAFVTEQPQVIDRGYFICEFNVRNHFSEMETDSLYNGTSERDMIHDILVEVSDSPTGITPFYWCRSKDTTSKVIQTFFKYAESLPDDELDVTKDLIRTYPWAGIKFRTFYHKNERFDIEKRLEADWELATFQEFVTACINTEG